MTPVDYDPSPLADTESDWLAWLAPLGEAVPLDVGAARLAAEECGADPERVLEQLDQLAAAIPRVSDPTEQIARLAQHLFGTLGLRGDTETYDDPRNSCLDQVIVRRRGLPIVLSVLTVEVALRLGLTLLPIGFPGHFLVSTARSPRVFLDPFDGGRIRSLSELALELEQRFGAPPSREALDRALAPSAPRDVLVRMSTNLMGAWLARSELAAAVRNADRRVALRPEVPLLRRDRGLLRAQLGDRDGAAMDLGAYLAEAPDAQDAVRVRWQLTVLLGHAG
jgi:regulator of sirC expression with transglutaminase-like and TPR domain